MACNECDEKSRVLYSNKYLVLSVILLTISNNFAVLNFCFYFRPALANPQP